MARTVSNADSQLCPECPLRTVTVEGYNCTTVTTYPQLSGPGSGLGETALGTTCTAVNGAPASGTYWQGEGELFADGTPVVFCEEMTIYNYPSSVTGWRCAPA